MSDEAKAAGLGKMRENLKLADFDLEQLKKSKANVIFFGPVGAGKTSLLNTITGCSYSVATGGFSETRMIQYAPSLSGAFLAVDSPGIGASVDVLSHARVQYHLLKNVPFSLICIVVNGDQRFDPNVLVINDLMILFQSYKMHVCVVVTHADKMSEKNMSDLEHVITHSCKIPRIFFSRKDTPYSKITSWIEAQYKPLTMVTDPIFPSYALKRMIKNQSNDLSALRMEAYDQFNEYLEQYKEYVKNNNPQNDLRRAFYFSIKEQKDILVRDIWEKGCALLDADADIEPVIAETIIFQNDIYEDLDEFKKMVFRNIELESFSYNGQNNRYKKCPKCSLVWFKVYGCDSMRCGNRSVSQDVSTQGYFYSYKINLLNGLLNVISNSQTNDRKFSEEREVFGLTREEEESNKARERENRVKIEPTGCGYSFKWAEAEDVTEKVKRGLGYEETSLFTDTQELEEKEEKKREKIKQENKTTWTKVSSCPSSSPSPSSSSPPSSSPSVEEDLEDYLKKKGIPERTIAILKDEEISLEDLKEGAFSGEELAELGVKAGPRKKLLSLKVSEAA